jgi:hypothetical protein
VPEDRLLKILNTELGARCADCKFTGPLRPLDEPYPDGGNWARSLVVRGRPADPYAAGTLAADVVEDVAARYNLAR